ncbi:hypothetical protein Metal_0316 [Methylomicrobium album BG8]|uniref:Uncharacterized protein n=1 Tax=Methylomicrobium album BG8 TaxID=686340 RepID=H8GLX9_METAL|nr:hypothetical protein Metal_0316 [Methylomicrobium album BG8]
MIKENVVLSEGAAIYHSQSVNLYGCTMGKDRIHAYASKDTKQRPVLPRCWPGSKCYARPVG